MALEPMTLYSGEFLFLKGDASDALYIILSGRIRVLPEDRAQETLPVNWAEVKRLVSSGWLPATHDRDPSAPSAIPTWADCPLPRTTSC